MDSLLFRCLILIQHRVNKMHLFGLKSILVLFKFSHKQSTGGVLKGALSGLRQFLLTKSLIKNNEKCFLFYLKNFFRSQDVFIFGHVEKRVD